MQSEGSSIKFILTTFKVARCCVHADTRKLRKGRIYRGDKGKEEESGVREDEVQMLCERLSTTSCRKDEKRAHQKTSKILQKSILRKLEMVTQPTNTTPRDRRPLLTGTAQPSRWHEYSKFNQRFPSPRVIRETPLVRKQTQFQGKVVAKKLATKTTTLEQTPND